MSNAETTILLYQVGSLAITSNSIPSLIALPAYLGIGLWRSASAGILGKADVALVFGVGFLQILLMPLIAQPGMTQLSVFSLTWPVIGFLFGYGVWRLSGNRPLMNWPWYRFGLLVTLLVLVVDLGSAMLIPPAAGKIWQIGGASFLDALVLAPPVLTLTFFGLLDCRSPLVFCSKGCRDADRCLHGMVDKIDEPPYPPFSPWKRCTMATVLAAACFFLYTGLNQRDTAPAYRLPVSVTQSLEAFIAETSAAYGIATPALIQVGGKAVAFTRKAEKGGAVEISLGDQFASNKGVVENGAITRAIVAHEMGHAILFARNQGFPNVLLLMGYILTLAALLCAAPNRRGMVGAGAVLLVTLTICTLVFDVSAHAAIKGVVLCSAGGSIILAWAFKSWKQGRRLLTDNSRGLIGASSAACAIFFLGMPSIGALNTSRELFADRVAACEVGPAPIIAALTILHPVSAHPWIEMISDPFHPPTKNRLRALEELSDHNMLDVCGNARLGK